MNQKWLVLGMVLGLAGCGSKNEISVKDVENALAQSPRFQAVCVPFALDIESGNINEAILGNETVRFLSRSPNGKRANSVAAKQMDYLVDADIYDDKGVVREGEGESAVRYYTYHLTDKGRRAFIDSPNGHLLCIGQLKVEKVNYYTEPTPANGITMSQVSYEAKIKTESWARKLLKDSPYHQGLTQPETRKITLVKTNQGWLDIYSLK